MWTIKEYKINKKRAVANDDLKNKKYRVKFWVSVIVSNLKIPVILNEDSFNYNDQT